MRTKIVYFIFHIISILFIINGGYAKNVYVSSYGNDSNSGSIDKPFLTVQKAINTMYSGDNCYLRQGVYHEEVWINNASNLTIQAYPGENPLFDGSIEIDMEWINHSETIFKTTLVQDIWQLFVNGEMMTSARWPNAGTINDDSFWTAKGFWEHGTSNDKDGVQYSLERDLPDDITGSMAILNVGNWKTWVRNVNSQSGNSFTYDQIGNGYQQKNSSNDYLHQFYIEGKLNLLDAENEWFYDKNSKELFLYKNIDENSEIRGKVHSYGFNMENSNNIKIQGIYFFASTFRIKNSSYCEVKNCHFRYPSYSRRMLGDVGKISVTTVNETSDNDFDSYCIIDRCSFAFADGPGIYIKSKYNEIRNCLFHHIDYSCVVYDGKNFGIHAQDAPGILFTRNTAYKLGGASAFRSGPDHPDVEYSNIITYNHIHHCGYLQNDGAGFQIGAGSGKNVIIAYNWVHDTDTQYGIRFDGKWTLNRTSTHRLMHHNVAWNCNNVGLYPKGNYHEIYNNTAFQNFVHNRQSDSDTIESDLIPWANDYRSDGSYGNEHSILKNNAATVISGQKSNPDYVIPETGEKLPGIFSHNWIGYPYEKLENWLENPEDPFNGGFMPKANSPLIDAGEIILTNDIDGSDITQDYVGSAPDIGAYERGGEYWVPGITWNEDSVEVLFDILLESAHGTAIVEEKFASRIKLHQNYPNPFNPTTNIQIELDQKRKVQIELFDINGKKVKNLFSGYMDKGINNLQLNGTSLASGVYYYRLNTIDRILTNKCLLIK